MLFPDHPSSSNDSSSEGERVKLLSQLRERAINIGEKGVRFLGMSPEQVSQVLEFAGNLRRGVAELPLNDRSKELLSEISRLKSEREIDKITIIGLEREISAREPRGGENRTLEQILEKMTAENQKIRDDLKAVSSVAKLSERSAIVRERTISNVEVVNKADTMTNGYVEMYDSKNLNCCVDVRLDSDVGAPGVANGFNKMTPGTERLVGTNEKITHERSDNENGPGRFHVISMKCKALEEEPREAKGAMSKVQQDLYESPSQSSADCMRNIRDLPQPSDESVPHPMSEQTNKGDRKEEIHRMSTLLKQTQVALSGYVDDVKALHSVAYSLLESQRDSSRVATHVRCLNDIIREKSRIIQEGKKNMATLKQRSIGNLHGRENCGCRSDHSTSSIDEAIERAVNNTSHESHTSNNRTQLKFSEDASKLLFERENVIYEQNHKIMELKQKLSQADMTHQRISNEAQSMKFDSKSVQLFADR